jgi:NAD(P)-dependent dehydrogenase (short-subunit alcohol dehydrogenase family)
MGVNRRVAIVTGAASGIGKAISESLIERGFRVVAADYNVENGQAFEREVDDSSRLKFFRLDVGEEEQIVAAIRFAMNRFESLDVMVNNAGIGGAFGPITEIEVEDWDYTFHVLVRGVFLGIKHAARALIEAGRPGAIVNTASIGGLSAGAGPLAYSAAKAAVINLTKCAAVELAPHRIRVNAVCPGAIATGLTPVLLEAESLDDTPLASVQPWPELGRPIDVARTVAWLVDDESSFVTGGTIVVDGGLTAAGPRLDRQLTGDTSRSGLVGVSHGSTGRRPLVRRRLAQSKTVGREVEP